MSQRSGSDCSCVLENDAHGTQQPIKHTQSNLIFQQTIFSSIPSLSLSLIEYSRCYSSNDTTYTNNIERQRHDEQWNPLKSKLYLQTIYWWRARRPRCVAKPGDQHHQVCILNFICAIFVVQKWYARNDTDSDTRHRTTSATRAAHIKAHIDITALRQRHSLVWPGHVHAKDKHFTPK